MTLAAHALAFGFPRHTIGRGVDLALAPGQIVCLLGPNGSGKTTLMRTLLGLLRPLEGHVTLEGRELAQWPLDERARRMAYVPQAVETHFDFTVMETVEMGRSMHRGLFARPTRRDHEKTHGALDRLGIAALADRPIHRVSGGERQLAFICRALASEASIVVLDEPTANLDFGNQSRVLHEVASLRSAGMAVLFCTHDPGHALAIADRAVLLHRGGVMAQGRAREILNAENLARLYGTHVTVAEVDTAHGRRTICLPGMA